MRDRVKSYLDAKLKANTSPEFLYSVFDIDRKAVVAEVWVARGGFDWVKISSQGIILEHYRQMAVPDGILFRSYSLDSMKEIEFYKMIGDRLTKFDSQSGRELGYTRSPDSIPQSFLNALGESISIGKIVYWAEKPYGRVIGLYA